MPRLILVFLAVWLGLTIGAAFGQSLGGCYDMATVRPYVHAMGGHFLPALSESETETALALFQQVLPHEEEYDFAILVESERGGALLVGIGGKVCARAMWDGEQWKTVKHQILGRHT